MRFQVFCSQGNYIDSFRENFEEKLKPFNLEIIQFDWGYKEGDYYYAILNEDCEPAFYAFVTINTIEDFTRLYFAIGHRIIVNYDEGIWTLEIYNGYRE